MSLSRRLVLSGGAALPFFYRTAQAAAVPDHLTFGLSAYPPNLNPWIFLGTAAGTVLLMHHRGLLSYAADGSIQGELAEHWEHDGGTEWVFHLRPAVFHNGTEVDASAVKWSFEQIAAPKSTAYLRDQFQSISKIETPDPQTVRIITKEPIATFPKLLAPFYTSVVAPGTIGPGRLPVGCGPYVLKSYERGVALEFTRFDKFYKPGLPKLGKLRFVAYADENLRVAALQAGNVDIIEYVPWQSMDQIAASSRLKLESTLGPFMYLTFNGTSGPFKDARVRQAVGFAIDRSAVVKGAFYGHGAPLDGMPIPEGSPFYEQNFAHFWSHDPDRARKLLAEAGFPQGFSCTLLSTAQYGMYKITAEVVQGALAAIGITAELKLPDWTSQMVLGNRGQFDMEVMGFIDEGNDPSGLAAALDGTLPPSFLRSHGIVIPGLKELFSSGRAEFDQAKRKAIYDKVQSLAAQFAPIVPLCWRSQAYAMKKSVMGFENLPNALTYYSGYTLEDTYLT